jgi:hypothetical protein
MVVKINQYDPHRRPSRSALRLVDVRVLVLDALFGFNYLPREDTHRFPIKIATEWV